MKQKNEKELHDLESTDNEIEETNIEETEEQVQSFIQKNATLISVVFIIVIGIAGYLFWSSAQLEKKTKEANLMLSRILPQYEENNFEAALNGDPSGTVQGGQIVGLSEIARNYSSTQTGAVAALLAGNSMLLEGNATEAKEMFQLALESESKIVVAGANAGIGACFEKEDNYEQAANYYNNASIFTDTPEIEEQYKYFAALAYENHGDKDKAGKLYSEIVKGDTKSEIADLAKSGMVRVGMIID